MKKVASSVSHCVFSEVLLSPCRLKNATGEVAAKAPKSPHEPTSSSLPDVFELLFDNAHSGILNRVES